MQNYYDFQEIVDENELKVDQSQKKSIQKRKKYAQQTKHEKQKQVQPKKLPKISINEEKKEKQNPDIDIDQILIDNDADGDKNIEKPIEKSLNNIRGSASSKYDIEINTVQKQSFKQIKKRILGLAGAEQRQDQKAREQQLENAKKVLAKKIFIVWIFVIRDKLSEQMEEKIKKMYDGIQNQKKNIVPRCKFGWQFQKFLGIPDCKFKIVTDLQNAKEVLSYHTNPRIIQIYVYNNKKQKGKQQALKLKFISKKVKDIREQISQILNRAQQEVQNEVSIYLNNKKMGIRKDPNRKFPSFLKLIGQQKTKAIFYRNNLFGALKITQDEKKKFLNQFLTLVQEQYGPNEKQNIDEYISMNHLSQQLDRTQAQNIVKFYVKESFYYKILNSMLRTMKTTAEFKPCVLPFNQSYHSIKKIYKSSYPMTGGSRKIQQMVLYRGAKLRQRDFNYLNQPGKFIQMFGFMSTSKDKRAAQKFSGEDYYLFVIHVPNIIISEKYEQFDHGFVDMNANNLAGKFTDEQQVLFNALNIYRVSKIQTKIQGGIQWKFIHLDYGIIFQLLAKKDSELLIDERDVLTNYAYCMNLQKEIQDQGDVHRLASEYKQSKEYYTQILDNKDSCRIRNKIAQVLQENGELENAQHHTRKAIQLAENGNQYNERQRMKIVFSAHVKVADIKIGQQDYISAKQSLEKFLEQTDIQQYQKAKLNRKYGEANFKAGNVQQSMEILQKVKMFYISKVEEFERLKQLVQLEFKRSFWAQICDSSQNKQNRERQKINRLNAIEENYKNHEIKKEQVAKEILRFSEALKSVSSYAENIEVYQSFIHKANTQFFRNKSHETNDDMEKAHYKYLEATVKIYQNYLEIQHLLEEAIRLVQSKDPNNEKISQYCKKLGSIQKQQLQKFLNPKNLKGKKDNNLNDKIFYNEENNRNLYDKCKKNFQKTIYILQFNGKAKESKQVLQTINCLGELELNLNKYKQSQKILKQSLLVDEKHLNTENAKSNYLLSKIGFFRGEIKYSFQYIQKAQELLRKAIIKRNIPQYQRAFAANRQHIEHQFQKAKIFHKQLEHDLSIRQLDCIQKQLKLQFKGQSHTLFALINQEKGALAILNDQMQDFDKYFDEAIRIRKMQNGQYAIDNGVCYCNYAKFLLIVNDLEKAYTQIDKATIVFSRMSTNHPIYWRLNFVISMYQQAKQNNKMAEELLNHSYILAVKNYDQQHISLRKIRLKQAKVLLKTNNISKSVAILEDLAQSLSNDIRQSKKRTSILNSKDDEKLQIQEVVKKQLQSLKRSRGNLEINNINMQLSTGNIHFRQNQ